MESLLRGQKKLRSRLETGPPPVTGFADPNMPSILRRLVRAGRHHGFTWRYGFNLKPTLSYRMRARSLSKTATQVISDLDRDGVAITSVRELLATDKYYNELTSEVARLEQELASQISDARATADNHDAIGDKTFNVELLGSHPVLDLHTIYARFALQKSILQIANAYFGMYTCLRYYNVWHTFATRSEPRESQLWHRDREDHQILKVFVYLSNVDEGAGALTYAPGTHAKGTVRRKPAYFLQGNVERSYDSEMAEVVPQERWVKALGPKGTIVFADTHGYHKGGLARERDHLVYTCMFTSQASQSPKLFEFPEKISLPADKEQSFALALQR